MLNEQGKIELLKLARSAIAAFLRDRRYTPSEPADLSLRVNGGAFVTLEKNGELRGCIGHLLANKPLFLVVQEMAIAAAVQDPRFPAVKAEEIPGLKIEISALSPFRKVELKDIQKEIQIGRHGLMVGDGRRRGLLLPQVAEREGWDVPTFLGATCRKAGLPNDAWKKSATIETFTAEVFSESESKR